MDHNKRFDQLESLLVDLARKQDQQSEQIAQVITELRRQGEAINQLGDVVNRQGEAINQIGEAINQLGDVVNRQGDAITRIERRLDSIDDQIGDIINIFKLSEARHTQHDQQLDVLTTELKEQGRRTDDALQVQLQMLALMRAGNAKTEELDRRLGSTENQEPRIQRLEDQVFRAAS
ncbi:MAG: hypothetical protein EOO56_28920 [Hymenobacter sp.]|nr:MAG: hypothetical protein EOO56_28920 [Hymenobacter sp.]